MVRTHTMKLPLVRPLIATALFPILALAAEKEVKPIVAVYDLEGLVSESGQAAASMFDLSMDASRPLTMLDLTRSLNKAAADAAVKAVVLDADGAGLDFSQIQEIRRQLMALREAGKDVWMYTEHLSNGTALLGSAANHFTLMPEAECSFHGIHAESMYFKGLLDKVGEVLTWPATHEQVVAASKLVPDEIVQMLTASGTPDDARAKVREYMKDGATCPILYPLGDVTAMIDAFAGWTA